MKRNRKPPLEVVEDVIYQIKEKKMPNKKDNELMVVMSNSLVQNKQPDNSTIATKLSYNLDIYQGYLRFDVWFPHKIL